MSMKPCIVCGEPSGQSRCSAHRQDTRTNRTHIAWRNDTKWKKFSRKLRKMSPFCELCGATNDLTVDHIIPVSQRPELAYKVENCRILCRSCNGTKAGAPPTDDERKAVEDRLEASRQRRARITRSLEAQASDQGICPPETNAPTLGKAWSRMNLETIVNSGKLS